MSVLPAAALPLVTLLVQSTPMATPAPHGPAPAAAELPAERGGPGYVLEVSGLPVDEIDLKGWRR